MKQMEKDLDEYRRQLYIYAAHVKQKYGQWPAKLKFNIFRENDWVVEEFDIDEFNRTMQWVIDTIHQIEQEPA